MHGRHPRLSIDTLIEPMKEEMNYDEYSDNIRAQLQEAYELASLRSNVACSVQKKDCDRRMHGVAPEVGDLVLVCKVGFKGKHKIQDKFEQKVYIIIVKDRPAILSQER